MKKIITDNYLFLIFFLILVLKEPIIKLIKINDNVYTLARCELMEKDYNKLLEFSSINVIYESDYINTFIIFKDIYNYLNEVTIRGGKDLGLNNNPIIYDNTLVGVIDKVNDNSSIVKLITNKDTKISVKINDEVGILENINGNLIVRNISNNSKIKVGDPIYTSGIGKIKENIFIGEVKNITSDNKKIENIIEVKYDLKIKDIDYVTIIKETI